MLDKTAVISAAIGHHFFLVVHWNSKVLDEGDSGQLGVECVGLVYL